MFATVVCPRCHAPTDGGGCRTHGVVARWVGAEQRIDWSGHVDGSLAERVGAERRQWDDWAQRRDPVFEAQPKLGAWFSGTTTMRAAARTVPEFTSPSGAMLDIGGTLRFGVRFLLAGVESIDHVEISPLSQRVALDRARAAGAPIERLRFHTTPAESLPFADASFDLVFASGTIHHTLRERSLPEIHRVLRPGGAFLLLESYLPGWLHPVMRLRRLIRRNDRGTDRPLGKEDVETLRGLFPDAELYPYNVLWLPWRLARRSPLGRYEAKVQALDERLGRAGGLARFVGSACWAAGHRSS